MTSEQVLLTLVVLLTSGCGLLPKPPGADPLVTPYTQRKVWAMVPLRNESGASQADGLLIADHLQRQLENASNIDVLPVNRTLAAMEALKMAEVSTPADAIKLLNTLGADALLVGTVTAYDPYDPPKIGLAVELYTNERTAAAPMTDVRGLERAGTDSASLPSATRLKQPVSVVSVFLDAADPDTRAKLERYASNRGVNDNGKDWRLYRISMDLYTEFVSYVVSWRLVRAENQRLAPPPATQPATQPAP